MNMHWPPRSPHPNDLAQLPLPGARNGRFELAFSKHGARTHIGRQFVSYPFHMTRPFELDKAIPSLLTIYQQSSSGGLYRGEELTSLFEIGAGAAAHVTTQAATMVHHCYGKPARQSVEINLQEGAFFAFTPDPLVLFPGAASTSVLQARLAANSVLLLSDAFTCHDPKGEFLPFDRLSSEIVIRDGSDRLLVRDRFEISGAELFAQGRPIGDWKIVSNFMLLGNRSQLPLVSAFSGLNDIPSAILGVTALPNDAGWGIRCLAADAIAARTLTERLFSLAVKAAFGDEPVPRRK